MSNLRPAPFYLRPSVVRALLEPVRRAGPARTVSVPLLPIALADEVPSENLEITRFDAGHAPAVNDTESAATGSKKGDNAGPPAQAPEGTSEAVRGGASLTLANVCEQRTPEKNQRFRPWLSLLRARCACRRRSRFAVNGARLRAWLSAAKMTRRSRNSLPPWPRSRSAGRVRPWQGPSPTMPTSQPSCWRAAPHLSLPNPRRQKRHLAASPARAAAFRDGRAATTGCLTSAPPQAAGGTYDRPAEHP